MSAITPAQEQAIRETLARMPKLSEGQGDERSACSLAAINLALFGKLTDRIPDCMSEVVGAWVRGVQDLCPPLLCRDHPEWRELLPRAAGTGREHEAERVRIVLDWMWGALALVQPVADANGFGLDWSRMLDERTGAAARKAYYAAKALAVATAHWAAHSAAVAGAVADAARAAAAAAAAAKAAAAAADGAHLPDAWAQINPVACLRKLVEAK